jgi:RNA polymerase sigma-70 factor (ECF subfamily)
MSNIDKKELHNLFEGLKHGKQDAAQELYKKYKNLVYGIAFSMLKNKDDSEDIVQNTFKRIIETDVDKLPKDYEATWMYTVTKNEALLFLQKKDNNINIEDIYSIQDKNDEIAKVIDCESYNKMISKLSNKEKEIVSLKIIADLSFNQIGKLLDENTNTTKWRYYNAIYKLKVVLSNISIAIISFVVGLATYRREKIITKPIENNETATNTDSSNTYSTKKENRESENKSIINDEEINMINTELSWDTKNIANQITENVENTNNSDNQNEITQIDNEVKLESNYISNGIMIFSIILLLITILIVIKNQLKLRKKPSK